MAAAIGKEERPNAETITRQRVESSSIASIGFRQRDKTLEIEFRSGAVYRYRNVPEEIFKEMMDAPSKGRFFSTRIRNKYHHTRVAEDRR